MILVCPQCETTFALPDELYKPGRKARCSQCGFVFPMPEIPGEKDADKPEEKLPSPDSSSSPKDADSPDPAAKPKKLGKLGGLREAVKRRRPKTRKGNLIALAALFICVVGILYGGAMMFGLISSGKKAQVEQTEPVKDEAQLAAEAEAEKARLKAEELKARVKDLALADVNQYVLDNEILGRLVVIQGRVVNNFTTPKDLIRVQARLFDREGRELASATQLCGAALSVFQLRVLNAADMTAALNNKIEILSNNTNIMPGKSVPFMVVFQGQPEGMYEFEVRPVDASDPPRLAQ